MNVTKNSKVTYDIKGLTLVEAQAVVLALTQIHNNQARYCDDTVRRCARIRFALRDEIN